jgi:16S rRNA (guanine527-N7)-methyltransferase
MEEILKHFPNLTETQIKQFEMLEALYQDWNAKINVISRKDIERIIYQACFAFLGDCKDSEV